jgi:hypothetical protein
MPQIPENTPLPLPNFSHSEEVDELLGKPPAWLLRSGISVIFIVLLSFFIASWFIKYPEVVSSQVVFTTLNPPVSLIARSSGKIQELFVKANDSVKVYEVIAVIENTADYEQVKKNKPPLPEGGVFDVISSNSPFGGYFGVRYYVYYN